jgi:hypothetical protein
MRSKRIGSKKKAPAEASAIKQVRAIRRANA